MAIGDPGSAGGDPDSDPVLSSADEDWGKSRDADRDDPVSLPITSLRRDFALRINGTNEDHVAALAEMAEELPPIVVHRGSMRVLDGLHRIGAAELRGDSHVSAVLVDGDDTELLELAVRLNGQRGLPLSRSDRRAVIGRLIAASPMWSDRRIAELAGVSHRTVGDVRRRSTGEIVQLNARVGADGRVRPRDAEAGRARVAALMDQRPHASLREIARSVGVSPATVLDVRRRRENDSPEAARHHRVAPARSRRRPIVGWDDPEASLKRLAVLRDDPAFRYSSSGRNLIRLLSAVTSGLRNSEEVVRAVPVHSRATVAIIARQLAAGWLKVADQLDASGDDPG